MGMFDQLRCSYPLPVEGANDFDYQTKDTPSQFLDDYEIRADGTLWHHAYDSSWEADPRSPLGSFLTRTNERWEFEGEFTGEVRFYTAKTYHGKQWVEFSAYFVRGHIKHLEVIHDGTIQPRAPDAAGEHSYGCHPRGDVRAALGVPAREGGAGDAVHGGQQPVDAAPGEPDAAPGAAAEGAREPHAG